MFPRDQDQQREVMYKEQVKTNELLETLIEILTQQKTTVKEPVNIPTKAQNQRRKAQ